MVIGAASDEWSSNWAVVLGSSRYYHNYRHMANVLAIYDIMKSVGMPDERIVVMGARDAACDVRNPFPADVVAGTSSDKKHSNHLTKMELFSEDVIIDYKGLDVSVESFTRVMTGRHDEGTPASMRMDSDEDSNVFVYLTGHGGDGFFKFHDVEELTAVDMAAIINDMAARTRYKEMLVFVDTCQAETMFELVTAPRVTVISSSLRGENSYAYNVNTTLGVAPMDRFTLKVLHFFEQRRPWADSHARLTVGDLIGTLDRRFLMSNVGVWMSPGARRPEEILLTDYFAPSAHMHTRNRAQTQTHARSQRNQGAGVFQARDFDNSHLVSGL